VICAIDSDLALDSYTRFLPTVVMALLTLMLTDTVERLRQLLLVIALSVGFLGLRFGLYGVVHGGVRFSMGHGGLMDDNNDLALGLAMVVPLCWYGCDMVRQRWLKLLFLIFVVFTIAAIVMTYSRGGALSLIVAIALVGFRSRRKGLVVAFFALITVPIGYLVGNAYWDRLATIQDPTEEASARSRFVFAEAALECAKDYPLVGVGFGGRNFMLIENKYVEAEQSLMAHNTYLQVLVDSGVMALFMYSGLLFGTILWLGKAAAIAKREMPGQELYPRAIQASLCAFAVGATFLSRVTFDMTYFLLIAAGALLVIQRTTRAAQLQGDEEV
jgi:probable O-glycosylation ligase (exosortase A-associated)